jgi:hypothetical protein
MNIFSGDRGESSKANEIEKVPTNTSTREILEKTKTGGEQEGSRRPKMASLNIWPELTKDGKDRSHIPPVTNKLFIIRLVQLGLAVLFLVLAAFAAFTLNISNVRLCDPVSLRAQD